jgi:hypothetical protein
VRLYSSLLAGTAVHAGTQLYRAITRQQHPLQWPPGQEWSVAMMKTLFTIGSYNHWRNFIKASSLSDTSSTRRILACRHMHPRLPE